jgi:epoxyqueuosine reductase
MASGPEAPIEARIKARASELGFLACGISDLSPTPHGDVLDRWLQAGFGGVMRYLNRQAKKRKDPRRIDALARSAVVCIDNYYYPETNPSRFRIARYARGEDYHRVTLRRLEVLEHWLKDNGASWARAFADAGPVPERELAQRAGLGWIGKNSMLIRPGVGSWFVIGSVLSDLELRPDAPFTTDHCGTCTRCLDACPTDAFAEPRLLDATRCISYQTIEKRGPIDPVVAGQMQGWIFGCDICNEVCPWNERFAAPSTLPEFASRALPDLDDPTYFDRLTAAEFAAHFGDTALERPGLDRMRRNVRAAAASGA